MLSSFLKKQLRPIFLAYLTLIVTISFALSMRDKICFLETGIDKPDTGNYFSSVYNFDSVDWLTENTTVMRRANEYSSCQMRYGLLRIFGLTGIFLAATTLSESGCLVLKNDKSSIQKNNVPLKLRI